MGYHSVHLANELASPAVGGAPARTFWADDMGQVLVGEFRAGRAPTGRSRAPCARVHGGGRDAREIPIVDQARRKELQLTRSSSGQNTDHGAPEGGPGPEWDERYASTEQVWSGHPNSTLVTDVGHLKPGRALDVGCGEGADAIWLANEGWDVTALDVSQVALQRAALAAEQAGVQVRWIHAGLLDAPLDAAGFDLVSAQYPALRRTPTCDAERALLAAVAPAGMLLVVHHADMDVEEAKARGFDPADYVSPRDVAALLDNRWRVEFEERRPRNVSAGAGAHHTHDVVLRAQRTQPAPGVFGLSVGLRSDIRARSRW